MNGRERGLSVRRACTLFSVARSALRYQGRKTVKDAGVIERMQELSAQYPRYGYRRIRIFLGRDGHRMSVGRAYRLWRAAGLQLPRKRPCQPSIAPDPREELFDDPAARVYGEADLINVLAHDLDRDQRRLGDFLASIPAVSEEPPDEREDAARSPQKRPAAVAILDARRMRFEHEAAAVGVDQRMALASVDLLSRIVTARAAGLGGLDALAVDDRGRGAGVAPDPFAIGHHERVVYPFKAPVVTPGDEPAVDRPPRRQVARHQSPRAACPHDIEDAIDDFPHRPLARPAHRAGLRQVRRDHAPLCVGQIGLVSRDVAAMLLSSGRCPHGEVQSWFKKFLGIMAGANDSTPADNSRED